MNINLDQLLADGNVNSLVNALEDAEIETSEAMYASWPLSIHMMGLMILGRLEDARLLWRRIPPATKTSDHADAHAAWHALQHLWNRDYAGFWSAMGSYAWTGQALTIANLLREETRRRVLSLIERCFTTVDAPKACSLLHLDEQGMRALAAQRGWTATTVNGLAMFQLPKVTDTETTQLTEADLERFGEYVLALES